MKPSFKYNDFIKQPGFCADENQAKAIQMLDDLYHHFSMPEPGALQKLSRVFSRKNGPETKGLYFWGGVGRGKTFIMDIFFETLPIEEKQRVHFHKFMKQIHDQLREAGEGQDPLIQIAAKIAKDCRVLCLDEFVVTDIGDAMLVGRLLRALFEHGTVLVTTSNTPPEDLYKNGLQRENFIPAIEQIVQNCHVYNLDGGQDYRQLGLQDGRLYQFPHDQEAVTRIEQYLDSHLVSAEKGGTISINDREIPFEYCGEDTIWFSFSTLCESARSGQDYLEIAQEYHTVIVTGIEVMDNKGDDVARRFISLIDVLYDHRVKLLCTAEVVHDELYSSGKLSFEFKRTFSRLQEMQSQEYMNEAHVVH